MQRDDTNGRLIRTLRRVALAAGAGAVVALTLGLSAGTAMAMENHAMDRLPACGNEIPLKPADCQVTVPKVNPGKEKTIGEDDYNWTSVTCPAAYPYVKNPQAFRDKEGALRKMSWDNYAGSDLPVAIRETEKQNVFQRANRYQYTTVDGGKSLAWGITGPYWEGLDKNWRHLEFSTNDYTIRVVCHSDGEFGEMLAKGAPKSQVVARAKREHAQAVSNARQEVEQLQAEGGA
jgi:hypothetical protein